MKFCELVPGDLIIDKEFNVVSLIVYVIRHDDGSVDWLECGTRNWHADCSNFGLNGINDGNIKCYMKVVRLVNVSKK